jgi:hypothetical protein
MSLAGRRMGEHALLADAVRAYADMTESEHRAATLSVLATALARIDFVPAHKRKALRASIINEMTRLASEEPVPHFVLGADQRFSETRVAHPQDVAARIVRAANLVRTPTGTPPTPTDPIARQIVEADRRQRGLH